MTTPTPDQGALERAHEIIGKYAEERKNHLHEVIGALAEANRRIERLEAEAVEPAITPEMLRAGISVAEAHFRRAHGAWRDLVVAVYRAMYLSRPSPSGETEATLSRKDIAENTGDPR